MEAHTKLGDSSIIAPTIDVMTFDDDGRITVMRAFWSEGDAREA
jgi:steroid delta-isomerase